MSLEDDILIDNYLRGNLSHHEVLDFEKRLKSDLEFRENFELEKALWVSQSMDDWNFMNEPSAEIKDYKKLLKTSELRELKHTLNEIDSNFEYKEKKKTNRIIYYLAAASIVVLLGFQFFFNSTSSNEELYGKYLKSNDLPSFVSRGGDSDNLVEAQRFFENKDYRRALKLFNSNLSTSSNQGAILIYKGLSETELSEYSEAENTFNNLINSDLLDAEKGYWYKVLLFLKTDKVNESKILLKKIISESLYNYKMAEELLDELK